jgi:hypothetical protein
MRSAALSPRVVARRRLGLPAGAVLALAAVLAAACEDTPEPLPEPLAFSGELAPKASVEHAFTLAEEGLVALSLDRLELQDTATGELTPMTVALRFGLGRPDTDPDDEDGSEGEGETEEDFCDESFLAGALEGSDQVFSLGAHDYCLSLADTSTTTAAIPDGKVAVYTLSLTSTE